MSDRTLYNSTITDKEINNMTLENFIHQPHEYDESVVIDRNGNELLSWTENDSKYQRKVLSVSLNESGTLAIIKIDYLKENYK